MKDFLFLRIMNAALFTALAFALIQPASKSPTWPAPPNLVAVDRDLASRFAAALQDADHRLIYSAGCFEIARLIESDSERITRRDQIEQLHNALGKELKTVGVTAPELPPLVEAQWREFGTNAGPLTPADRSKAVEIYRRLGSLFWEAR